MPVYNKLVRDLIPEIIERDGKTCVTRILDESAYIAEVNKKMYEELKEYEEANTAEEHVEELSDLLELIYAAAQVHGVTAGELEDIHKGEAAKQGGFQGTFSWRKYMMTEMRLLTHHLLGDLKRMSQHKH